MSEILNYLNSPHLVANFQKIFGIESSFASNGATESLSRSKNGAKMNTKVENSAKKSTQNDDSSKKTVPNSVNQTVQNRHPSPTKADTKVETIGPNSIDSMNKHKRQLSSVKTLVNNTDHSHIVANTTIHSRFWYYMFHLGAAMGNEIFYCLFFTFWFWNVDGAIARKVGFLWGIFMYVGQATKDILCMPRPASPPVVKLEERYVAEYGFPSTHAMVSAGMPISVVVLSYWRYNIDLPISIAIASVFCCWVCCSRLYLGMHSLLDVIAGVLYSILVLILVIPILEPIDTFMLENRYSPLIALGAGYAMCHLYPSLKQWSTARGDTAIIIGTVVGFTVGAYINNCFGWLNKPDEPPLYDIRFPNAMGYMLGVLRTIIGLLMLVATRQLCKASLLRLLCCVHGRDHKDPTSKKEKVIELPYNYLTFFAVGLNIAFTSPLVFRLIKIERDYSYTEL